MGMHGVVQLNMVRCSENQCDMFWMRDVLICQWAVRTVHQGDFLLGLIKPG